MDEKEIERIAEMADENLDDAIAELDEAILKADPEFAKTLSAISIDDAAVQQILATAKKSSEKKAKAGIDLKALLNSPFEIKKNPKKVIGFWIALISLIAVVVYVQITHLWSAKSHLFFNSFADIGAPIYEVNPETDVELFFENPKLARNLVTLSRMVTNIVPTSNSGTNPMLALELNIEGMNTEVVVEIKDREAEMKHFILRLVELENYDFLNTEKGKMSLAKKIREELNTNLTRGQVRKVLYKSFVIKR